MREAVFQELNANKLLIITVTGVTSLSVHIYRQSSRKVSRLFAEFVAPVSLLATSQLEDEDLALERKAAGAAFGRRYLQGTVRYSGKSSFEK